MVMRRILQSFFLLSSLLPLGFLLQEAGCHRGGSARAPTNTAGVKPATVTTLPRAPHHASSVAHPPPPVAPPPPPPQTPIAVQAVFERCVQFLKAQDPPVLHPSVSQEPEDFRGRCHPFNDGFFALAQRSYNARRCESRAVESRWSMAADYTLMYVDKDGKVSIPWHSHDAKEADEERLQQFKEVSFQRTRSCSSDDESIDSVLLEVYDLDSDGNPELLTHTHTEICGCMGGPKTTLGLWSLSDGALKEYAHAPEVLEPWADDGGIRDIDGDGRIDFPSRGPYSDVTISNCESDVPLVPQIYVYHSLANGTFTDKDHVSQRSLQKYCGARPSLKTLRDELTAQLKRADLSPVVSRLVCARAFGATKEQLLPPLRAACKSWLDARPRDEEGDPKTDGICAPLYDTQGDDCADWLLKLVNIEPPIRLN